MSPVRSQTSPCASVDQRLRGLLGVGEVAAHDLRAADQHLAGLAGLDVAGARVPSRSTTRTRVSGIGRPIEPDAACAGQVRRASRATPRSGRSLRPRSRRSAARTARHVAGGSGAAPLMHSRRPSSRARRLLARPCLLLLLSSSSQIAVADRRHEREDRRLVLAEQVRASRSAWKRVMRIIDDGVEHAADQAGRQPVHVEHRQHRQDALLARRGSPSSVATCDGVGEQAAVRELRELQRAGRAAGRLEDRDVRRVGLDRRRAGRGVVEQVASVTCWLGSARGRCRSPWFPVVPGRVPELELVAEPLEHRLVRLERDPDPVLDRRPLPGLGRAAAPAGPGRSRRAAWSSPSRCCRSSTPMSGPAFTTTAPSFWIAKNAMTNSGQLGSVSSTRSPRRTPRLARPPAMRFTLGEQLAVGPAAVAVDHRRWRRRSGRRPGRAGGRASCRGRRACAGTRPRRAARARRAPAATRGRAHGRRRRRAGAGSWRSGAAGPGCSRCRRCGPAVAARLAAPLPVHHRRMVSIGLIMEDPHWTRNTCTLRPCAPVIAPPLRFAMPRRCASVAHARRRAVLPRHAAVRCRSNVVTSLRESRFQPTAGSPALEELASPRRRPLGEFGQRVVARAAAPARTGCRGSCRPSAGRSSSG